MSTRRLLTALMLAAATLASPAFAKSGGLSPAKVKAIKKTRKSFENCRKDALAQLKAGTISKKKFEISLNACKENFPGASLYITCKKQAIKSGENKNVEAEEAVEQCKRYLVATQFDPAEPVPFFVEAGQFFFAGIGMNKSLPVTTLNPPNFACDKLQEVARSPAAAKYYLFGNHPRTFAGLTDKKGPDLLKALKFTKPKKEGVDVPGFGRVFGDPRTTTGTTFFPMASCDLESEPGDIFSGMSAYYLIDSAGSGVTPYFGIAYFKAEQEKVTTPKLTAALIRLLGNNFKAQSKDQLTTFIAAGQVTETEADDDKDPKNLCKQPRQHRFVGVVQGKEGSPKKPEYLILANVKALCDFGDRLGKRLTE